MKFIKNMWILLYLILCILMFLVSFQRCECKESAAKRRFRAEWKSKWNNIEPDKLSIAEFKFSPAKGLDYEEGVSRRDPSAIIMVDSIYYVWYTRTTNKPLKGEGLGSWTWDPASIWYATSPDGKTWTERGEAVPRGSKGSFDDSSVFTPDLLVANGRYYLYYQTHAKRETYAQINKHRFEIGMDPINIGIAWADSPDGPWTKATEPILSPGDPGIPQFNPADPGDYPEGPIKVKDEWDALVVHDPCLIVRDGKYMLYYKGRYFRGREQLFIDGDLKNWVENEGGIPIGWGVAIADKPEGPFIKSELNPVIIGGHEVIVWPYGTGVCALPVQGPERNTIQCAEDGMNFSVIGYVKNPPIAAGVYRPGHFSDILKKPGQGMRWGLCHGWRLDTFNGKKVKYKYPFLVRFDCEWVGFE